ncbi:predicted protein [Thalassiosira pseudonana CCMP1335]|uniref:Uncharacterized protein n=1 Tax=Thalassiosira pseudonana TaxID=35128 RepID=B8C4W8_THAPS|nr:predicted protein [Thalassiosira pseudonana CCMP1335]EED91018.1 predicted protein [Thalassiosira pseudonana CCMP1335]|eukprot:g14815.t1 g14815   contig90:455188-456207(-)
MNLVVVLLALTATTTSAFAPISRATSSSIKSIAPAPLVAMQSTTSTTSSNDGGSATAEDKQHLYVPSKRDEYYQGNVARYLLDLNEEKATFDFCGGMMFQLVLTDKLKSHLQKVSTSQPDRPIMHPASQPLMNRIPDYYKSSYADNIGLFHGREIRRVPNANGGMGFVLQLSYADPTTFSNKESNDGKAVDPQGWSSEEITTYDGWRGDTYRKWRNAATYVDEGFDSFSSQFGKEAYGLNHRFYLHLDNQNRMWLSAEDGCEGTPKDGSGGLLGKLGGFLFG